MPANDPLGPVWPGDRPPSSARAYNAFRESARAEKRRALGEAPPPGPLDFPADPASVVLVRAVADALDAWQVSTYGTPSITPVAVGGRGEVGRRPKFDAGTPAAATDEVCITIESAVVGDSARAVATGVAVCRLLVNDESHVRAVPIPGDKTRLGTAAAGGYAILWKPDEDNDDGERWALVLLSGGNAGAEGDNGDECKATLAGLLETSRIRFQVREGNGRCAEIVAKTIAGWRPDPDVEEWVSLDTFPTKAGDTSLMFGFDEDTGLPVVTLTATTGEGTSGTTTTQKLTLVGCVGGCLEFAARPRLWCDSGPVTDCALCPDGAPRRYRVTLAGGTGGYAALNGTHTFLRDSGCLWLVTTPGFTGQVLWVDMGGGNKQIQAQLVDDATGAFISWNTAEVATAADCCGTLAGTDIADFDPGIGGAGDTPALPTVVAVGPCAIEHCADNTFRVRVCCQPHTKYACLDALPDDGAGAWCFAYTPVNPAVEAAQVSPVMAGPSAFTEGSGSSSIFKCNLSSGIADGAEDVARCGWRISPTYESNQPLTDPFNTDGNLEHLLVYYEPDADDGAGAWALAIVQYCEPVEQDVPGCCLTIIATAANDPDPTDDPFEIVFRWASGFGDEMDELRITRGECPDAAGSVCDSPACPDGAADEYTFPLAGGTGDYVVLNGSWTVAHVAGDEWVGTLGTATATLDAGTGLLTFEAPGFSPLAVYRVDDDLPFGCCDPTVFVRNTLYGSAEDTEPDGPTLTPVGDCECP